jgi:hypothetical protein
MVKAAEYPQLSILAWNRPDNCELTDEEALGLYESNWRHVDPAAFTENEKTLLRRLIDEVGNGVLNV